MQRQLDMNERQNDLNRLVTGGRRKRRRHRGGTSKIPVPQFQMQYTPIGGPGTNPNDQVAANAARGMQLNSDAVYDKNASLMGGRKKGIRKTKRKSSSKRFKSRRRRVSRRHP